MSPPQVHSNSVGNTIYMVRLVLNALFQCFLLYGKNETDTSSQCMEISVKANLTRYRLFVSFHFSFINLFMCVYVFMFACFNL